MDCPSPREEPLGKRGDKADLDHQPHHCLQRRQDRHRIAEAIHWLEEAPSVKAADAQHQRLVPRQRHEL